MSRFRRRLMGLAALRQAAADDFVRVEYIENISNAYIDTLINLKSYNYKFELDCQQTELKSQYAYLMGQEMGYENYRIGFYTNLNLVYAAVYGNLYKASTVKADEERHKYIYDKNILYVDGVETVRTNTTSSFYNKGNHLLLLRYFQTAPSCKAKIYSCKIYENGELVRDYIPMYQKSRDRYGLWDRVEEKFYTSPNGVKFIGGERVIADADDNIYYLKNYIYINSTQTQYIILKPFTENDNVELKVHPIGATNYWFGDRSAIGNQRRFQIASWNNTRLDIARNQFPSITYSKGIINKDITLKLDGKQFYVNNELLYTFTSTLSTTNNTNLGRVYNTGRKTNSRFYWFKWWNKNKDLVYDLIPVQRCSDGVWGFFDKVSLVFHPSDGTEQFTGG